MARDRPADPRRDLALLSVASAVAMIGWSMLTLLLPLLALRYGAGAGGVGVLVAGAALLPLWLAIPIGRAVDRWGARRVVAIGFAGTTVALLPMAIAPSLTWLVVAFVVGSALQNAFIIGAQALIAVLGAAGRRREAAYGWWTTAMAAGQVVGPVLAGVALDLYGAGPAIAGVAVATASALGLVLTVRAGGRAESVVPPFRWAAGVALVRDRTVGIALLTSGAAVWAMTVHATYVPIHLEALALSSAAIGAVVSLRSVAAVVVRPFMAQVTARLGGRERTAAFTLVAMAAGLAGIGVSPSPWAIGLWVVLFGAGHGLSQPISMAMVADRVAARERGAALGVRLMLNWLAQVVAPVAFAFVAERAGLVPMFVVHAVVVAAAAVALGVWTRRPVVAD
ncbi:MAG: MFS transporter [Trueperaceae bacterium]|nr:MFS transporter [Trueperaceae bacterium]